MSDEQEGRDPRGMVGEALAVAAFEIGGSALLQRVMDRSDRFDPKDPLIVAVLQSETRSEHHLVTISLKNAGAHGVYVEAVTAEQEQVTDRPRVLGITRSVFHGEESVPLPLFVEASGTSKLMFRVSLFGQPTAPGSRRYGFLDFKYTVLGVHEKDLSKRVPFIVWPLTHANAVE